jgi:hypothetical protein
MSLDSSFLLMTSATDVVPEIRKVGVVSQNWQRSANSSVLGFKLAGLEGDWLKIKISNHRPQPKNSRTFARPAFIECRMEPGICVSLSGRQRGRPLSEFHRVAFW